MKKVDLSFDLLDLKGEKIDGGTAGELLGLCLQERRDGDKLKNYHWAKTLTANKPLELDASDFDQLKTFVKNTEMMNSLASGQILEVLNEVK